jgi:small membrane protein
VQIIVQIVLVLAVITVSLALMRGGSNAQHLAIRRLMLLLFALVAAFSIFFPTVLTHVARFFGIGRGTDLVLYGLIVSVLVFMATTYQRFRNMESTLTKLSRRIAIDEAPSPVVAASPDGAPATTGTTPVVVAPVVEKAPGAVREEHPAE